MTSPGVVEKLQLFFLTDLVSHMPNIKKLSDIVENEGGNKAQMLKRLAHFGFNIPDSYVILDLSKSLDKHEIYQVYKKLNARKVVARMSTNVEDSNEKSYAGVFKSVLNISSNSDLYTILSEFKNDLFLKWPHPYKSNSNQTLVFSCVIQPMIEPLYSGILFTTEPDSGRSDLAVISFVKGHNHALTAGLENGYRLIWDKNNEFWITDTDEWKNNSFAFTKLIKESLQLSRMMHIALDIEWAIDHCGEIYWLQARPITTLPRSLNEFDGQFKNTDLYTFVNTGEVFSGPISPLTQSTIIKAMNNISEKIHILRWKKSAVTEQDSILFKTTFGHLCLDVTFLAKNARYLLGFKPEKFAKLFGEALEVATPELTIKPNFFLKLYRTSLTFIFLLFVKPLFKKACFDLKKIKRHSATKNDFNTLLKKKLNLLQLSVTIHSLACLNASIFMSTAEELFKRKTDANLTDIFSKITYHQYSKHDDCIGMYHALLNLQEHIQNHPEAELSFYQQNAENALAWLKQVATQKLQTCFLDFIKSYGHRGVNEFNLQSPSWAENPLTLIQMLQIQSSSCITLSSDVADPKIKPVKNHRFLAYLARSMTFREQTKSFLIKCSREIRHEYLKLEDDLIHHGFWQERDLIFFLTYAEIETMRKKPSLKWFMLAQERQRTYHYQQQFSFPLHSQGQPKPNLAMTAYDQNELRGHNIGTGIIHGKASVIHDFSTIKTVEQHQILVTNFLDVCHIPILLHFAGIITENGSALSHVAILLRESKIPSILGVSQATLKIKNGDNLQLNCSQGTINILHEYTHST
jgi:phosphohistidine swiveling domain-containing protein